MTPAKAKTGAVLGYARVSTGHQSLDQQLDALHAAGVDPERVYRDKLSGTSTREQRPGLAAVLDYARPGDAIVVVGIDRLGRNAAEVMLTIRELRDREIVLRSLREGIDTSNATGRMVAGVLASLAELELELGRDRRAAAREARHARGQAIGRPKALDKSKAALARRMHGSGEPVATIAAALGVSRATVYRVLAEEAGSRVTSPYCGDHGGGRWPCESSGPAKAQSLAPAWPAWQALAPKHQNTLAPFICAVHRRLGQRRVICRNA